MPDTKIHRKDEQIIDFIISMFSEKEQDGEHVLDAAKRNKVRSIFVTGRDGLTPYEAAVMLVQEARTLVQVRALLI